MFGYRPRVWVVLGGVVAASVFLGGAAALADSTKVRDPRGDPKGGKPDLKSATAAHTDSGMLKFTIVQYNDIRRAPVLVINGGNKPCNEAMSAPYNAYMIGLRGGVYRPACANYQGSYTKSRPDSKTIVYTFAKSAIGRPKRKLYWAVRIPGEGETQIDVLPNRDNPHAVCPGGYIVLSDGKHCQDGWDQEMVVHKL